MKTKTGLLALGVFTVAGALTVSCGGSSDNTDNTPTAGKTGTGGSGSAGKSSSAGTTNNDAGTTSNNGGTSSNGGNANNGGRNNMGGFNPGAGGDAPTLEDCPATAMTGKPCTPQNGGVNACQVNDTTYCVCQGQGQSDPTWFCPSLGDIGAGGDGGGLGGAVTCPANVKSGDTCTGIGLCPGSQTCGCVFGAAICQ